MEISFKSKKLERICNDFSEATQRHGKEMAVILHNRMDQLRGADSVDMMTVFKIGNCHPLIGDRIGQFALYLRHPYRLIFKPEGLGAVRILEIVDYH